MRSIPAALKEKLANRFKVENTDSMARLRVVATQTSVNSLLSEPIHEDIAPAFGDVAVSGQKAQDVVQPDPCADAGDQIGQPVGAGALGGADLRGRQGLDLGRLKAQLIDAEARVHLGQAAREQGGDPGGIAHRRGKAQFDLLAGLIDAAQRQT